jgi:hypothetical protein
MATAMAKPAMVTWTVAPPNLYILLKALLMLFRREGLCDMKGVVHDLE